MERFFPKDDYAFAGIIHERLTPRAGDHGGMAPTGVTVRHSGYEHRGDDPDHKGRRNLPLLEAAVAAAPESEYYHYHIGRTLYALRRYAEAAAAFERSLALIDFGGETPVARDGAPLGRELLTTLVTTLAYAYVNTGRLQDAEALLTQHIGLAHPGTDWADFYHVCGYVALMLGDIERARAAYTESMRHGPVHEDVAGTGSYASAYHLGLLAEAERDLIGAIDHYGAALEWKPDYRVALDRYLDFMVENELGVAPGIQRHADPEAFRTACLQKLETRLEAGEKDRADFIITTVGLLATTNRDFAGDLLDRCQEIRRQYGIA